MLLGAVSAANLVALIVLRRHYRQPVVVEPVAAEPAAVVADTET